MKSRNRRLAATIVIFIALYASSCAADPQRVEGIDANEEGVDRTVRDYSDKCGDSVTCERVNNVFYVKGTGKMTDYTGDSQPPWISEKNSVTTIVVEQGVTSIGDWAFYDFYYLTNLTIGGDVKKIGSNAFAISQQLENVVFPESLEMIGDYAFYYSSLKSVTIPNRVTSIGDSAFRLCEDLSSVSIGTSVKTIGDNAFLSCAKIESVVIPDSVKTIGECAFAACTGTVNVTIGNSVTTIGPKAFQSCKKLFTIFIPDSVTEIGYFCFSFCDNLKSVVIGDGLTTIGDSVFSRCYNLASIVVGKGNKHFVIVDGVLYDIGKTILFRYPSLLLGNSFTIPDTVKTIANNSFEDCCFLKNVVIPDSVKTIEYGAFQHSSLASVTIGDGVTQIGSSAFDSCGNLTNVIIGSNVKTIKMLAFIACPSLTHLVIPASVEAIESYAFEMCSSLNTVFYQGAAVNSGTGVFDECDVLENVCVSPAYKSDSFCDRNVTSASPECQQFRKLFNSCYQGTYKDGKVISEKRDSAAKWEELSDGCFEHQCNNETGLIKWSICNSSTVDRICLDGQCSDGVSFNEDKWAIEMEMSEVKAVDLNISGVIDDISVLAGVGKDDIMVGLVVDEKGYVLKVVAYVGSEEMANLISKLVDEMDKGDSCKYEAICQVKSVHIKWIQSISDGNRLFASPICMMIMFFLVLCHH